MPGEYLPLQSVVLIAGDMIANSCFISRLSYFHYKISLSPLTAALEIFWLPWPQAVRYGIYHRISGDQIAGCITFTNTECEATLKMRLVIESHSV